MSTNSLIQTISETIHDNSEPPEYSESLTSQIICVSLDKSDQPPDYEFLYNKRVYYANRARYLAQILFTTSKSNFFELKITFFFNLILKGNLVIAGVIIIVALQVVNIVIGKLFEDECKSEPNIPAWLITFSIGMLILTIDLIGWMLLIKLLIEHKL